MNSTLQNSIKWLIFISLGIPCFVYGQVNEYFNHNPVWQVNHMCSAPAPCIENETYNYYVNGDTVFNGLTYKKIYKKGTGYYSWFGPPPGSPSCTGTYSYVNAQSEHFVRSDAKKIFIRVPNDTAEYLLYDFNLQIGDSLPLTYNNYQSGTIVTAIDSIATPYGYRQRFTVTGQAWITELVEGIGHDRGFLEPVSVVLECGFYLNCFSLNDTIYYPASPTSGPVCELTLGSPELSDNENGLLVFPNPFNDFTTIMWKKNIENASLILYDIQGKEVNRKIGISGNQFLLQREKLDAGMYFFELKELDGKVALTGKILIQ